MDKNLIAGLVAGVLAGLLSCLIFGGFSLIYLLVPTALGGVIGFLTPKFDGAMYYGASALIGAAFYVLLAYQNGWTTWIDDIVTGAIFGALIALLLDRVVPRILNR